ncbi:MAG: RHS repeat-associated core domain-containing protein [Deltaproteobacteria bacterium]|nr:RHS repeat-associated core domain-containing protein [Deltaproteobacteria bacterium]
MNNLRLPGQYLDQESGLHYNYYRYYDPVSGRYLRADPIGLAGMDPNIYGYVLNNPVNWVDPLGLLSNPLGIPFDLTLPDGSKPLDKERRVWTRMFTNAAVEATKCMTCTATCSLKVIFWAKLEEKTVKTALKQAAKILAKEGIAKAIPVYNVAHEVYVAGKIAKCFVTCIKK